MLDAIVYNNKQDHKHITIATQDDHHFTIELMHFDERAWRGFNGYHLYVEGTPDDALQHAACLASDNYTECITNAGLHPAEKLVLK